MKLKDKKKGDRIYLTKCDASGGSTGSKKEHTIVLAATDRCSFVFHLKSGIQLNLEKIRFPDDIESTVLNIGTKKNPHYVLVEAE